ncbi:MAG: amylo-alpha-1,6-glucosidase [Elusimicrobia bacterium]|nr:amylo-alpha-1,6-glucosidase [Elusimicrobiota bacterium]
MSETAEPVEDFYILSSGAPAEERARVLKHGETFGVFDGRGDIRPSGAGVEGLYHEGTRYLSRLELRLGRARPLFLSSTIKEDNAVLAVDLTNPDIGRDGALALPRGALHIHRTKFLVSGFCYERLRFYNYHLTAVRLTFTLAAEADFADVFEVRGRGRPRRGRVRPPEARPDGLRLSYEGLDGVHRRLDLAVDPAPARVDGALMRFELVLEAGAQASYDFSARCSAGAEGGETAALPSAMSGIAERTAARKAAQCLVETDNATFNHWLQRSASDLAMTTTDTPQGPFPYAGVPWYSAPFGRDALITALETLWCDPRLARGVLAFLAATQAAEDEPRREAEPGKILHEARLGEMAALDEIPFGRYYGTVDATPLFVVLAGEYLARTGELDFIAELWPNVRAALGWLDRAGQGYLTYKARASGLSNQGWKDSVDSISLEDGTLAAAPIALCEVQAYFYAAKIQGAELAAALGRDADAGRLRAEAHSFARRFERDFWSEPDGCYALALGGDGRQCGVRSSNAGHCLAFGISSQERSKRLAKTLLAEDCFSGWGIRTLSSRERRYNPMSYHNGSVWPHDTALIGAGFFRRGLRDAGLKVFSALYDASAAMDLHRLPELFCGFERRGGEGPTLYPVACSPQAWASGAVFLLLGAALGISIDARERRLTLRNPALPPWLDTVRLSNLAVGAGSVDLNLTRRGDGVSVEVLRRSGHIEVVAIK